MAGADDDDDLEGEGEEEEEEEGFRDVEEGAVVPPAPARPAPWSCTIRGRGKRAADATEAAPAGQRRAAVVQVAPEIVTNLEARMQQASLAAQQEVTTVKHAMEALAFRLQQLEADAGQLRTTTTTQHGEVMAMLQHLVAGMSAAPLAAAPAPH